MDVSVAKFAIKVIDKLLVPINPFSRDLNLPKKYKNRKLPFKISRSYSEIDQIEFQLTSDMKFDFLPEIFKIQSEFGEYEFHVIKSDDRNMGYIRKLTLNEGVYTKDKYVEYRNFIKEIIENDNLKFTVIKL